ncbi:MAG: hypothetical protein IKA76_05575 [Clostridia bacterium]|nr:hypothetical protein [Clostridia bacterium]
MIKKITAMALALILLVCAFASCGADNDGAPEGMKSATLPGEPFMLYVPEAWSLNTSSGISGAYFNSPKTILVSARHQISDASDTDAFIAVCEKNYAEQWSESYKKTSETTATLLGGEDARKLSFSIKQGEDEITCFQVTTYYAGGYVSVNGYCATELYEARKGDFDAILKEFKLCEPSSEQGEPVMDKKTPDGFQVASSDELEYRMYVPTSWICHAQSGTSEAKTADGSAHVAVSSYAPDFSTNIKDYFTKCEATYKTTLPNYSLLERDIPAPTADGKVAGRTAYSYIYTVKVDDVDMKIMQTIFFYNEMAYSFTYTAKAEAFDTYLPDVNAMLSHFTFR